MPVDTESNAGSGKATVRMSSPATPKMRKPLTVLGRDRHRNTSADHATIAP